jgi:flagellar motor switch protein FliG
MVSTPALANPRQRAAAFVLAIGTGRAEEILEHLRPSEIEALAEEIARLSSVDPSERAQVIESALADLGTKNPNSEATALRQRARQMATRSTDSFDPAEPFAFLEHVEIDQAVQFLGNEHPQTVAVVLANQSPSLAGKILRMLEPGMAADIALRIATLGRTSPELMQRIRSVMQSKLSSASTDTDLPAPDGAKGLAAILNNAEKEMEEQVLSSIEHYDAQLAEQVRSLMFVFEDITSLDDKAIQQILQNVETQILALSLKGTSEEVQGCIFRNLSERAREALTEEIDLMGAVRKSDVAEAQATIVAQIRALESAGQIVISRGDENDYVE